MVVYVCKQTASICQVTIEMAVAPGDETKEMRLLHSEAVLGGLRMFVNIYSA